MVKLNQDQQRVFNIGTIYLYWAMLDVENQQFLGTLIINNITV